MQRRHDLDWVRVCAFGLLVLYHVGMYYVTWDWHVKSPAASDALEPFMLLSSPWRLALLFLVSGAATAFLLERQPRSAEVARRRPGFLASRSWRLLVPLVFGMLVIVPPQSYYEVVEQLPGGYHDGYLAFYGRYLTGYDGFCDADGCLDMPTWNHLWFVAYLWVYTMVLWLLWRMAPRALIAAGRGLDRALAGIGIVVWPTLFLGLVRILLVGRFEQTHALVDDWYNHAQYFSVFLLGFLIARSEGVWAAMVRARWVALLLWLATWAGLIAYFVRFADGQPPELLRTAMRMVWGLDQWCAIVAVLGFARHWNPGDSRALRYLVPAVFPVYILHQTVTVVLAHHLKPLAIPPLVEGILLVMVTFAACFAGYEVVRRVAWLRPLFGLKRLPGARTDGSPAMAGSTES